MDINDREMMQKINKKLDRLVSFKFAFLRGAVTALGATVGLTVILTFSGWLLTQLSILPIIGVFANDILEFFRSR